MIISESIGSYSQTIKVGHKNEVEVRRDGKELFKGEATHIVDIGNKLTFKDKDGKEYAFVKYAIYTCA